MDPASDKQLVLKKEYFYRILNRSKLEHDEIVAQVHVLGAKHGRLTKGFFLYTLFLSGVVLDATIRRGKTPSEWNSALGTQITRYGDISVDVQNIISLGFEWFEGSSMNYRRHSIGGDHAAGCEIVPSLTSLDSST